MKEGGPKVSFCYPKLVKSRLDYRVLESTTPTLAWSLWEPFLISQNGVKCVNLGDVLDWTNLWQSQPLELSLPETLSPRQSPKRGSVAER